MVDQKSNAQILNGVNDDISEMKSLTTLRKRVVTDGEIVSKSQSAFRLAGSKTGVILRNDGNDFYALVSSRPHSRPQTSRRFRTSSTGNQMSRERALSLSM